MIHTELIGSPHFPFSNGLRFLFDISFKISFVDTLRSIQTRHNTAWDNIAYSLNDKAKYNWIAGNEDAMQLLLSFYKYKIDCLHFK